MSAPNKYGSNKTKAVIAMLIDEDGVPIGGGTPTTAVLWVNGAPVSVTNPLPITTATTSDLRGDNLALAGNIASAAWGTAGVQQRNAAATFTDTTSSGTVATVTANSFGVPTFAASAATTYTTAATLYIAGDPAQGTNVTLTNTYAFVNLGKSRLDGAVLIGAGAGSPATSLHVVDTGTATPRGITNDQYNNGTNSAQINLRKARGTFASPATIVTGDVLSRVIAWGHDGTSFIESGNIRFTSSGTIGTGRVPSQMEFYTSTNAASSVLTLALTLDSSQTATFVGNCIGSGALNAFNVAAGVTPTTELEVDSTSTSSPRGIMSAQFNTGTDGARFHGRKARGTRASPTTVVSGDNLTRWVGSGYDGSSYLEMASIIFGTEGTIASTRVPTNIQFQTATDAAPSVLTTALTITSGQVSNFTSANASNVGSFIGTGNLAGVYVMKSGGKYVRMVGGSAGGNLVFDSTGPWSIAAASSVTSSSATDYFAVDANGATTVLSNGTNQNITLTPSGAGLNVSAGPLRVNGTNTLRFGATANATIGVTADTTAGNVAFTGTSTGIFTFDKAIRGNGGFQGSDGSAGLTQASTATLGRSITLVNGLVTAFA